MLSFNITRRFRVSTGAKSQVSRLTCRAVAAKSKVDSLTAMDDSVLSYLAESIVRELAEKGTLTRQFRQELFNRTATIPADSDLPLVSVGPSGIYGGYQTEL